MPSKVPLGQPLEFTDDELDLLSEVTEEDIQNARRLWIESAPDDIKDLLDAVEVVE